MRTHLLTGLACLALASCAATEDRPRTGARPSVGETTVLGPFVGPGASAHPDNQSPPIAYAGADLGWSYVHDGKLMFLFGDTQARVDSATNTADPIDPDYGESPFQFDDSFGSVDLSVYGDPSAFPRSGEPGFPLISLAQHPGSPHAMALNPGHWMDAFKTPFGGWSNGDDEYAVFFTFKPQGCEQDLQCRSRGAALTCDAGLGYWRADGDVLGAAYYEESGFTFLCVDGSPGCIDDAMIDGVGRPVADTGFCVDETSSIYDADDLGRTFGVGHRLRIGVRNAADPRQYDNVIEWLTSKFKNISVATVQDFQPAAGAQDYTVAAGAGDHRRVFIWGRPGFIGVGANGRNLGLYFAYVDMPVGEDFGWEVNYFTGVSNGTPQFSPNEADAVPLDLDADAPGVQTAEAHDNVFLQNVVWVEHLRKWAMFYGGGVTTAPFDPLTACGALELFTGPECRDVDLSNSAIHMRTADHPWGPWSPPEDVLAPGDAAADPPTGLYADGGILYHPDCAGERCAPFYDHPAAAANPDLVGVLYSPIIHAPWIEAVGDDVDLIWSVSTANPYGVVLLRTRIEAD